MRKIIMVLLLLALFVQPIHALDMEGPFYYDYVTEKNQPITTEPLTKSWTNGMQIFGEYDTMYAQPVPYSDNTGIVALKTVLVNNGFPVDKTINKLRDELIGWKTTANLTQDQFASILDTYGVNYELVDVPTTADGLREQLDKGYVIAEMFAPSIGHQTTIITGYGTRFGINGDYECFEYVMPNLTVISWYDEESLLKWITNDYKKMFVIKELAEQPPSCMDIIPEYNK